MGSDPWIMDTNKTVSEICYREDLPFLKMWDVLLAAGERPFRKHFHTRFEITLVTGGSGVYETEEKRYPMEEGDLFVFCSGQVHSITKVGPKGLTLTNLHLEVRDLMEESGGLRDDFIFFSLMPSKEFVHRIEAKDGRDLRAHFLSLRRELYAQDCGYRVSVRAYLDLILTDLLRRQEKAPSADALGHIRQLYRYIDEHLTEDLTLSGLAQTLNLSPNYVCALFKKQSGISLWDYITAERVERAWHTMQTHPKMTMLEVALRCGFNNTANFNKAFKKHKGVTPSRLKRDPNLLSQ